MLTLLGLLWVFKKSILYCCVLFAVDVPFVDLRIAEFAQRIVDAPYAFLVLRSMKPITANRLISFVFAASCFYRDMIIRIHFAIQENMLAYTYVISHFQL